MQHILQNNMHASFQHYIEECLDPIIRLHFAVVLQRSGNYNKIPSKEEWTHGHYGVFTLAEFHSDSIH